MECPHLSSNVSCAVDSAGFPHGAPSSWCCTGESVTLSLSHVTSTWIPPDCVSHLWGQAGQMLEPFYTMLSLWHMEEWSIEKQSQQCVITCLQLIQLHVLSPVCRSNKSPWICLTCTTVHCGRWDTLCCLCCSSICPQPTTVETSVTSNTGVSMLLRDCLNPGKSMTPPWKSCISFRCSDSLFVPVGKLLCREHASPT